MQLVCKLFELTVLLATELPVSLRAYRAAVRPETTSSPVVTLASVDTGGQLVSEPEEPVEGGQNVQLATINGNRSQPRVPPPQLPV